MDAILTKHGMSVSTVPGVQSALDALRKNAYQCLVLDLMLPDGDGGEVLRDIRDRKLDMWVCVVTAASDPLMLDTVARLRPQRILKKPIDMGQLLGGLNLTQ